MSTIFSRKDVDSLARALVQQYNALHQATVSASEDGYHRDVSGVPAGDFSAPSSSVLAISAASASSLALSIVSALNCQGVLHVHFNDDSAHLKVDAASIAEGLDGYAIDNTSAETQLSSVCSMLTWAKAVFNEHLSSSGVHLKSDTQHVIGTTDATDLSSAEALADALKVAVNAHILSGPSVGRIKLV